MVLFKTLAVISVIVGIAAYVLKSINQNRRKFNESIPKSDPYGKNKIKKELFELPFNPMIAILVGGVFWALTGMFFYADAGTAYAVQYPWGGDKMVATQGVKTKFWGRVIPLSYEISIQDKIVLNDEPLGRSGKGIYNRKAHLWEFSDAIKAEIGTAIVIGITTDDDSTFLRMADANRSESKLIYGRVMPNIDAALKNTCKLMDAQEYISGKASDFDRYFRDQLENGMYLVEEYVQEEETPEVIGDTNVIRTIGVDKTKSNKQIRYRIKRDSQGNILRDNKSNTLKQYGITIFQAQVTNIDWEPSFDERLQLQKEQVAQTQLEKQEAEKEFYRAKKEIAKGESEKAKERAKLEKEQIKLTIAAETRARVADQDYIAEKKRLEVEKLKAQSRKVAADAKAYENQKLVNAGLTPQERAEWEYKTAIGVAEQIKDLQLPSTYLEGGSGSGKGGSLLETLIGAEMAKKMLNSNK